MPFTLVQKKTAASTSSGTSLSVTLDAGATGGNLLVACGNGDDFKASDPSGFTLAVGATDFTGTYIWYKVAAGGETTVTHTINSSTSIELAVYEYATPVASPLDVTASATHGDVTSASTGTTATTNQADELAVATFGNFQNGNDVTSYTNSFTEDDDLSSSGSSINDRMWVAHKDLSATGTQTTTVTYSGGISSHPIGLIATFKAGAAAAAPPPMGRARPGKTWKRRFKHPQRLPLPPAAAADIRSDTGLATLGLSADSTVRKIAVVTARSALGLAGSATAVKVAKSTSPAAVGLTGISTAKKVAPATGIGAVGLAANFAHVEIHPITALLTLGLTATNTSKKITPTVSPGTMGLAGTNTAKKVGKATGITPAGLAGLVTAKKVSKNTGVGAVGLMASFAHVEIHPVTVLGAFGLTSTLTGKKRSTPLAAGTVGLFGFNTVVKKISKSTGVVAIGLEPLATVRKKQGVAGLSPLGLAAWWDHLTALANALSYPTVTGRASVSTVTSAATSTATMSARASSTPSVSDG